MAFVDVEAPHAYKAYGCANAAVFEKYGLRFIILGAAVRNVEGEVRSCSVVIEFASYQRAFDYFDSPEYAPGKYCADRRRRPTL
ncbi:DUF1330 domain-containing protein [Burkholderia sp. BCC1993]|uniref:DUF1330 domain-containing protein n=1 Tax=Burkholderia sp. BCC1993 TaxID=2817444 RepID=UPI002AB04F87|nr:DUF1330 domain-containing protein [Burkholderia sp. BCC1993]